MSEAEASAWPGLPLLVRVQGRPVILLGDGEAAEAKRRLLARAGAHVVTDHHPEARLAVVAIDDDEAAHAAVAELRARGVLVNAVDRPDWCDFTLPAVVDRAPVLIAVATGGVSAGLAAALRQRLEALLPASLARLAEALQALRPALRARHADPAARRGAIGAALAGLLDPLDPASADRAEAVLLGADLAGAAAESRGGMRIALTSGDPDALTLRQARALALAERVYHAPGVPAAILARARADAPRLARAEPPTELGAGGVWVEMAR